MQRRARETLSQILMIWWMDASNWTSFRWSPRQAMVASMRCHRNSSTKVSISHTRLINVISGKIWLDAPLPSPNALHRRSNDIVRDAAGITVLVLWVAHFSLNLQSWVSILFLAFISKFTCHGRARSEGYRVVELWKASPPLPPPLSPWNWFS